MIPPMIETNTSKFKNIDNEVIIDKISIAAKELNFTNDTTTFIKHFINGTCEIDIRESFY